MSRCSAGGAGAGFERLRESGATLECRVISQTDPQTDSRTVKPTVFLLFSLVPLLLATFILWLGAPMVVHCHHVAAPRAGTVPELEASDAIVPQEGRVDVTMHRRLLGVLRMQNS